MVAGLILRLKSKTSTTASVVSISGAWSVRGLFFLPPNVPKGEGNQRHIILPRDRHGSANMVGVSGISYKPGAHRSVKGLCFPLFFDTCSQTRLVRRGSWFGSFVLVTLELRRCPH